MRLDGPDNLIDISYFCNEPLSKTTVVMIIDNQQVAKYKPKNTPYGISLSDVVPIDAINYRQWRAEVFQGGKIQIARSGQAIIKLNQKKQVKINSPLYVDSKTAQLTTKVCGKRVGRTLSTADENGYTKIEFDFRK